LDFTSTEKKLGKPVGSDLLNGHITLPILLEMRKNPDFKLKIEQLRRDSERKEFEECIQIIRKSDSIDEAKAVSSKYLSKALNLISELPDGHPKSLLLSLTKKMGSRNT
ncbi:polyprenyl synthetase family protein, partial [Staphylococcus aureus]|nr:polyprenyl synthetase family protein [Staphylococcus aureus]